MTPLLYAIQILQAISLLSQLGQDVVSLAEDAIKKLKHYADTGEGPTEADMAAIDALIQANSQALKDAAKP
jgi:hypothetical protein